MSTQSKNRLSVSTYSFHRALGVNYRDLPGDDGTRPCVPVHGPGTLTLLELPKRVTALGIHTLEISHPHLPSRDPAYLNELRDALVRNAVQSAFYPVYADEGARLVQEYGVDTARLPAAILHEGRCPMTPR